MKKLRFVLALLFLSKTMLTFCQFDTEFWFAIPYVTTGHDSQNQYRIVFSASTKPSTITISLPANPSFTPVTFSISANSSYIYNFSARNQNNFVFPPQTGNIVLNTGIKITTTEPVFCYYEVDGTLNTEIYALKGTNALGKNFILPFQNYLNNGTFSPTPRAYFYITATEDNTKVTITPTKEIEGHATPNMPFDIMLNTGQVYAGRVPTALAANRPVGSLVRADKKISIIISDDSMDGGVIYNGCQDVGGDQLVPVELLGTEFIPVQGFLGSPFDAVFILATQSGQTIVSVNNTQVASLTQGQLYRYNFPSGTTGACHIKTSKASYVYQLSGFGCEVGYSILPPIDCRGSRTVSVMRSANENFYLTLLTKTSNINNFTYTGIPAGTIKATDFLDVPNTGGTWKYLRKSISLSQLARNAVLRVDNSSGVFHMGIIHGGQSGTCKFGYFSDFSSYAYQITSVYGDTLCEGQTLMLSIPDIEGAIFKWEGPNGFTSTDLTVSIPQITPEQSGTYFVHGNVESCNISADTVYILVCQNPVAKFTVNDTCFNLPHFFKNMTTINDPAGIANMTWDFGDGETSEELNPTHIYNSDGVYIAKIIAESQYGCKDSMEVKINVWAKPIAEFTVNSETAFTGNPLITFTSNSTAMNWFWNFGDGTHSNTPHSTVHQYPLADTSYIVTLIIKDQHGCADTVSHPIRIIDSLVIIPNIITPNGDGTNDRFVIAGLGAYPIHQLIIYNRWGRVVFRSENYQNDWNGNNETNGVYFVYLKYGNNLYQGTLTIVE